MIAAEFEAIQLYEQLAESTDNELARKVLLDITREEKEHVGEFRHLLMLLAPEDEADYAEGVEEAENYLAPLVDEDCDCDEDKDCGCHGGSEHDGSDDKCSCKRD